MKSGETYDNHFQDAYTKLVLSQVMFPTWPLAGLKVLPNRFVSTTQMSTNTYIVQLPAANITFDCQVALKVTTDQ